MQDAIIELSNIEINEHCILNRITGEKKYNKDKKQIPYFTGFYFKDENTFFALYPTENGPIIYYKENEYPLKKDLHIYLNKKGKIRTFCIKEYDIYIEYKESQYIGFDVWSEEADVDLFFKITQCYRDDEFYKRFRRGLEEV